MGQHGAATRTPVWAGLLASLAVALGLTAWAARSTGPPPVDTALAGFTRDWADALGWPVTLCDWIGRVTAPMVSSVVALAVVVVLARARRRAAAAFLAIAALAGVVATEVVKLLVGRARPPGAEQFQADLTKSFPSGHASAGIYLYLAAGLVLVQLGRRGDHRLLRLGQVLVVAGPLIGLTRIVLGVHWPTDVLAGWAFGSAAVLASALAWWAALGAGWAGTSPARSAGPGPGTEGGANAPAERDDGPCPGRPGGPRLP